MKVLRKTWTFFLVLATYLNLFWFANLPTCNSWQWNDEKKSLDFWKLSSILIKFWMTWHATWIQFNSMNLIQNVKVNSNFWIELNWIEHNFCFSFWTQHGEGSQCWSLNWVKLGILSQWCWLITYLICIQIYFYKITVFLKTFLVVQTCTSTWK